MAVHGRDLAVRGRETHFGSGAQCRRRRSCREGLSLVEGVGQHEKELKRWSVALQGGAWRHMEEKPNGRRMG